MLERFQAYALDQRNQSRTTPLSMGRRVLIPYAGGPALGVAIAADGGHDPKRQMAPGQARLQNRTPAFLAWGARPMATGPAQRAPRNCPEEGAA